MNVKITRDWIKSFFVLGPTVDLVGKLIKSRSVTERSAT